MSNHKDLAYISAQDFVREHIELNNYNSLEETIDAILTVLTKRFQMNASYLSQIQPGQDMLKIVAFYSNHPDLTLNTGNTYQLHATYCNTVAETSEPVAIENTAIDPQFQHTQAHKIFPNIGSYIGVPVIIGKDTLYGTLCVIDTQPKSISASQIELLVVLARLLATQIIHNQVIQAYKDTEHQLRNSEERYREFIERSPDMVVILARGNIHYINPAGAHMLEYDSPQDVIGKPVDELLDASDLARGMAIMSPDIVYPAAIRTVEYRIKSRTGRQIIVEVNGFPSTRIEHGLKLIARDITQRKKMEAELASAHQDQQAANIDLTRLSAAKSHFVSIVSHEFRTALTGIQGFSEMMCTEDFTIDEMRDFAKDINEDAKRLNRMITEMLDLDRMESGSMVLHRHMIDINTLIKEATVHDVRIHQHSHQFHFVLADDLPHIPVDHDKLIQVVKNLLSNAIKYSPNGGTITITSKATNGMVRLAFQDQGIGLTPEAITHIFERYQRVNSGATRHIAGTGLGLPITRQIVEMHHGTIWVESVAHHGSTFYVELPLHID